MKNKYVGLLRGINVGGKNTIQMNTLATMFTEAGASDVQTYIQSGNVVFAANPKIAAKIGPLVCERIHQEHGFQTHIVTRSQAEMELAGTACPYADLEKSHIVFLAHKPSPEQVALLDTERSAPDQFTVCGREIYLHLPNGGGRTKLTNAYFDSKLQTVSTVRNWRTFLKLLAMMSG